MPNILHLSHHIGCFKDQSYVLNKLGFQILNFKFYDHQFYVSRELANDFWNNYKDTINKYDYVLISDTSPISRSILQNIDEFESKLVIWICNRFDYAMHGDNDYYQLFKSLKDHKKIRIVASTLWEKIWCLKHGIDILDCPVINPLGKFNEELNSYIPKSDVFNEWYNNTSNLKDAEVFVPFYTNDNNFFNLSNFLSSRNITVCNTTFKSVEELKNYKAVVTLPDTFCKWLSFELIHEKIPAVIPSIKFLNKLCLTPGYLFNKTGYGGAESLTSDLLSLSEWYNQLFNEVRFHFDDFEEIPDILSKIDKDCLNEKFNLCSLKHEQNILSQWENFYASF